jgi:hypothetical protein
LTTKLEWCPWIEASRWTSFHHKKDNKHINKNLNNKDNLMFLLIITKPEKTILKVPIDARTGHGLTSTKWNGLSLFIILLNFCDIKGN